MQAMSEPRYPLGADKVLWSDDFLKLPTVDGGRGALPDDCAPQDPRRINADPERIGQGMAQLVLTVIELLRQLMERQALRRVEHGTLTDQQQEALGTALMHLAHTMTDLKNQFGLTDEDLNLHLGPLGDLL